MSIHSKATAAEEDSPFYKAHRQMAAEWEAYAKEIDTNVSGHYNAWQVVLEIKSQQLSIKGSRQLTTVAASIPYDGRYQETTVVQLITTIMSVQNSSL